MNFKAKIYKTSFGNQYLLKLQINPETQKLEQK